MQSEFYKAGYDETMQKLAGPLGVIGGMLGKGISRAGGWLGRMGGSSGALKGMASSTNKTIGWLGGKLQGAARGLGNTAGNLSSAPGQTLWQGAGNFGKNMLGMGNAATTSGVLGRGAMGYGLYRGMTGGPRNNMAGQPGNNMPGQPGNNLPVGFRNTGN